MLRSLLVLAALLLPMAAAQATNTGVIEETLGRVFTEIERQMIEDFYGERRGHHDDEGRGRGKNKGNKGRGNSGNMPPGLANRDQLPPGLAMQLERNGTLPPGLAKRDLPPDLLARLTGPARGTARQVVGTDVLLVDTATGIILDILRGAAAQ